MQPGSKEGGKMSDPIPATDNPCCAMCRNIRRDRYDNCTGICKMLMGFLGITQEEADSYTGASGNKGQKPK